MRIKACTFNFLLVAAVISLTWPLSANACVTPMSPTKSEVSVVIKMGLTYFQFPEKFLYGLYKRYPHEVNDRFTINFPNGREIARIDFLLNNSPIYNAQIASLSNKKAQLQISDDVSVLGLTLDDAAVSYLKDFIIPTAPTNWEADISLAKKFNIGIDPCDENAGGRRMIDESTYTEDDVLKGLQHKNEAMRAGVAKAIAYKPAGFTEKEKLALIKIAEKDELDDVRASAIYALGSWSANDRQILDFLANLAAKDSDEKLNLPQAWRYRGTKSIKFALKS